MTRPGVLLIGNYPPPFGGVPQHISRLAPYLVRRGWDVHVVSGGWGGRQTIEGVSIYRYSSSGLSRDLLRGLIHAPRLRPVLGTAPRVWAGYVARLAVARRLCETHQIAVISAYNLIAGGPVGALLSQETKVPLVVSNFGELHSRRDFITRHGDLLRYVCSVATAFLSCSAHCARSYGQIGVSPDVRVIPYGVNVHRFAPGRLGAEPRERFDLGADDTIVLYVGRMVAEMGLDTFLGAVPQLVAGYSNVRCIAAGASGELLPNARETASRYPRNFFVAPDVPPSVLPDYYAAATVIVVPTAGDRACSSLAAMEAMASGRPVVAANIGGIPEVVVDGVTGVLVPPRDFARLASELLTLLSDRDRIARMGAMGRERAVSRFDEDVTNRSVEEVFEAVATRIGHATCDPCGRTGA